MALKKTSMKRGKSRLVWFLLLILLGGGVFAFWVYRNLTTPLAHGAAKQIITIEPGLGTRGILVRLSQAGVISYRLPLMIYLTFSTSNRNLKAGEYTFESPITPLQVIEKIRRGQIVEEDLTIPEGLTLYDVVELLKTREFHDSTTDETIAAALKQTNLVADLDPQATSLEGYLFPDTYTYTKRTTDTQLIAQMVRHFHNIFTPEFRARAVELGLTVRQVVTLASLIEKEARVDEDRPLISSVFHNRLKKGMRLECDPTFIYAAMLDKTWDGNVNNPKHRRSTSPYNTYFVTGLPSGPIASPGLKSLKAALYPTDTQYLYFVLGEGGKHRFSRTEAEHLVAVAQYRRMQGRH